MADTFTINYAWTKPEVGSSNNSWGGKLNDDLDDIDTKVKEVSDASKVASNLTSGIVPSARGGAGTVNGLLKANGSGVVSQAVSGSDYAPATSGSSILKGNASGGFSNAVSGTDYAPATSGSGILKGNGSGGFSTATSGTDYCPVNGSGATGTWGISITGSSASATTASQLNGIPTNMTTAPMSATIGSVLGYDSNNQIYRYTLGALQSFGVITSGNIGSQTVSAASTATTASTANALNISNAYRVYTLGVGTGASGVEGEIRATNNVTAYYSDDRLKTRLGKIENALDKLCSLDVFFYHANERAVELGYDTHRQVGMSAQQWQKILPEVVVDAPINDSIPEGQERDYLTMRYERTTALIVAAIKELRAEVKALKAS